MSFISFNYNKNLIYAIIYWALEILTRSFMYLSWDQFYNIVSNDAINEYIYIILLNIADLLAGFLVLYINCSLKKKGIVDAIDNLDNNSKKNKKGIIEGKGMKLPKSKSFIYKMISICALDYLNRSAFFIFYQIFDYVKHDEISHKAQKDIIIHFDIIARYIFSILILKIKVFTHHKLAIIIIFIGFIILIPTDIISIGFEDTLSYKYIGMIFYRGVLFPFQDTIVKKVFIEDYIMPEFFMFLRGFGEFIIILIITPFLYFFVWNNIDNIFSSDQSVILIILIVFTYIIQSFIKAYVLIKVIYYFSSQSVSFLIISEAITGSIAEIIKFFILENHDYHIITLIIDIIVVLITTFGTLIYDEILIIKKWGLNINVAAEIRMRANSEVCSISVLGNESEDEEVEEDEIKINNSSDIYD